MIKAKSASLLGLILVLLQLLNPFLHAHAQGLDGTSGFHVHGAQNSPVAGGQSENPLLMVADAEHWVMGMPTAHRVGEHAWDASDSNDIAPPVFWFLSSQTNRPGGFKPLKVSPPDWRLYASYPPPALAPPSI